MSEQVKTEIIQEPDISDIAYKLTHDYLRAKLKTDFSEWESRSSFDSEIYERATFILDSTPKGSDETNAIRLYVYALTLGALTNSNNVSRLYDELKTDQILTEEEDSFVLKSCLELHDLKEHEYRNENFSYDNELVSQAMPKIYGDLDLLPKEISRDRLDGFCATLMIGAARTVKSTSLVHDFISSRKNRE